MNGNDRTIVSSCAQLAVGDALEAFYGDALVHRGPVTATEPGLGRVWILDTLSGRDQLIDLSELMVVRLAPRYREVRVRRSGR